MNLRTRHMALLTYSGLAAIVLVKDMIVSPTEIIALLAPIAGMFAWDKIRAGSITGNSSDPQ